MTCKQAAKHQFFLHVLFSKSQHLIYLKGLKKFKKLILFYCLVTDNPNWDYKINIMPHKMTPIVKLPTSRFEHIISQAPDQQK